jgi:hypothetical protein
VLEGVTFTVEGITSNPEGVVLAADQEVCGQFGAESECIGLPLQHDSVTLFCTLVVQPTADFENGTVLGLSGTLECPTQDVCDAMATREIGQGPPIVICDPEFTAAGNDCVPLDPAQDPIEAGVEVGFGGPPFGEGSEGEPMEGRKCTSLAFDPDYPDGVTFTVERVIAQPADVVVEGSTCGFHGASCIGYVIDPAQDATSCSVELIIPESVLEVFVVATEGRLTCPSREVCDQVTAAEGGG